MPPPAIPLGSHTTPSKPHPHNRFNSDKNPKVDIIREQLRHDMEGKYICLPYEEFMAEFLPISLSDGSRKFHGAFDEMEPKKKKKKKTVDAEKAMFPEAEEPQAVPKEKAPKENDLYSPFVSP